MLERCITNETLETTGFSYTLSLINGKYKMTILYTLMNFGIVRFNEMKKYFGENVFVNSCCCFQDQGGIYIGDGCLIGHRATIATINHGLAVDKRNVHYLGAVRLGDNVWLGSNVTILPGVSIGDGAIVAAGAVVTKDVAAMTIVGGNPARKIRDVPAE